LHFVNEIPWGSLKKFELQTELVVSLLQPHLTYRDPQQWDEFHHAPGDNDPLDVNSQLEGPEANMRSMSDMEKLWPGRTMQILSWMDDFKQHQNAGATHLHYEVHGVEVAMKIVRKDHEAWRKLLKEVDARGFAREHWVGRSHLESPVRFGIGHHQCSVNTRQI